MLGCHFSWLWGGYMTLRVYFCPFVPSARTWQKNAAWLSSASLWCLLMAPKFACELTNAFVLCVCLPKGNNVCYICFLAFLFLGWPSVHFLFSKRSSHTSRSISTFNFTWIQKYISVLMSDSRLTHDWFTICRKTCDCDWLNRGGGCAHFGVDSYTAFSLNQMNTLKRALTVFSQGLKGPYWLNVSMFVF